MADDELIEIQDQLGYLLIRFSVIEQQISQFIAHHYIKDSDNLSDFYDEVISDSHFSFELKVRIFKRILNLRYPTSDFPFSKLKVLQEDRNKLAHNGIFIREGSAVLSNGNSGGEHYSRFSARFLSNQSIVSDALKSLPGSTAIFGYTDHYDRSRSS